MKGDERVEENELSDSQVSLKVIISDQNSAHVEQVEFLNTTEMSNEDVGMWVSRPDCPLEVFLQYFSRKSIIDSSGRQVGTGDNTKEVNLEPKIFVLNENIQLKYLRFC